MKELLVLDNYDSFTYNLVQYLEYLLERRVDVYRNDALALAEVDRYDAIVLSPGPGLPEQAGILPELIHRYAPSKIILGVCLGHQAIGEAFGAGLKNLERVYHGLQTPMYVLDESDALFAGLPNPFPAGRYHSWVVQRDTLPEDFVITAEDAEGEIMAMRHRAFALRGVQFHPESVMTMHGIHLLANWLTRVVGLPIRSSFENPALVAS